MASPPYTYIPRDRAFLQPVAPAVVAAPRSRINPLFPICCCLITLFLIAATIVLALIPLYVPNDNRGNNGINGPTVPYNVRYQINNGTLPVGPLSTRNRDILQQDQRNFFAGNNVIRRAIPFIRLATSIFRGGRRRRQDTTAGDLITIEGFLLGINNCDAACLNNQAQTFVQLLIARDAFVLTLFDNNGNAIVLSFMVISADAGTVVTETTIAGGAVVTGGVTNTGNFTGIVTGSTTQINSSATTTATATATVTATNASAVNDIAILNYALILERLEANFYGRFQNNFTADDFIAAGFSRENYDYLNIIYVHELAHVRGLVAIITQLGYTPVPECVYNFSMVTSVSSYLNVARVLENTGTMAYDGAANGLADTTLRQTAATVATVEARHAAYLNLIRNISPFPSVFENATVPSTVVQAIGPFLVSCPFTVVVPAVPYIGSTSFNGTVPASNVSSVNPYTNIQYSNDINVLNYALIAENLEAAYYNRYVSNFTSADYLNNGFTDATSYFIMIREHENAHVQAIRMAITQRGGTPVPACTYNFNVTNVVQFVNLSRLFENTGQKAYDGVIGYLTDPGLILVGATIATVEGRHASYLNRLSGAVPFPDEFDPTLTPPQVAAALSAYQVCPFTPTLPIKLNPSTANISG